jgi:hypothetical protein
LAALPLPPLDDPAKDPLGIDGTRVTLVGCSAALIIGTTGAGQLYLSMLDHGHALLRILGWHVSTWAFWGVTAAAVLRVGSRLSSRGTRPRQILEA